MTKSKEARPKSEERKKERREISSLSIILYLFCLVYFV